jgi:hypothetical protein
MSRVNFVGFQEHFEVPEDSQLVDLRIDIECDFDEQKAFSLIGEARYLSKWFYEITSFQSKPGGKIQFIDHTGSSFQGICTSYTPGREISLLSDQFGEFIGRVTRVDAKVIIKLHIKCFAQDYEAKRALFSSFAQRLKELTW